MRRGGGDETCSKQETEKWRAPAQTHTHTRTHTSYLYHFSLAECSYMYIQNTLWCKTWYTLSPCHFIGYVCEIYPSHCNSCAYFFSVFWPQSIMKAWDKYHPKVCVWELCKSVKESKAEVFYWTGINLTV